MICIDFIWHKENISRVLYMEKRRVDIQFRRPTFILDGNKYLISKVLGYLKLKNVLQLMLVDYSTMRDLRGMNDYWFGLWKRKRWGYAGSRYHYFHCRDGICYGCLDDRKFVNRNGVLEFKNRALRRSRVGIDMVDDSVAEGLVEAEEIYSICPYWRSYYREMIYKDEDDVLRFNDNGYIVCNPGVRYNSANMGLSKECGENHWRKVEVFPKKWESIKYDGNMNYYKMYLRS